MSLIDITTKSLIDHAITALAGLMLNQTLNSIISSLKNLRILLGIRNKLTDETVDSNQIIINYDDEEYYFNKGIVKRFENKFIYNTESEKRDDFVYSNNYNNTYLEDFYIKMPSKDVKTLRPTRNTDFLCLPKDYTRKISSSSQFYSIFMKWIVYNRAYVLKENSEVTVFSKAYKNSYDLPIDKNISNPWSLEKYTTGDLITNYYPIDDLNKYKNYHPIVIVQTNKTSLGDFSSEIQDILDLKIRENFYTLIYKSIFGVLIFGYLISKVIKSIRETKKCFSISKRKNLICIKCNNNLTNLLCSKCLNYLNYCSKCLTKIANEEKESNEEFICTNTSFLLKCNNVLRKCYIIEKP